MKLARYMTILKILSIVATGSYTYAIIVIFRTALFGNDGGLLSLAFYAGVIIFGLIVTHLLSRLLPKFSAIISWSLILLPAVVFYLGYRPLSVLRGAFEVVPAILAYVVSLKAAGRSAFQVASKPALFGGFFVLAACLFITHYAKPLEYLKVWMFGASYYHILVYLIIENQRNIDQNIFDKRYVEKSVLPVNLRRFNIWSVTVIFLIFVLLYNFKAIVAYILKVLGNLVVLIIRGIVFIIEKLLTMEPIEPLKGIPEQGNNLIDESTLAMNPLVEFLLNIIVYGVIIYAVYRIILHLIREVPKLVRKLGGWLKKFFSLNEGVGHIESFDYFDISEITRPKPEAKRRKVVRRLRRRKREAAALNHPTEKVRFMYSLFLKMLRASDIELKKSDTANDILKRAEDAFNISGSFSGFTSIYNQVRYGGIVPDVKMLSDAQGYFNEITDELRGKGKALPHKPYKTIEKEVVKKL